MKYGSGYKYGAGLQHGFDTDANIDYGVRFLLNQLVGGSWARAGLVSSYAPATAESGRAVFMQYATTHDQAVAAIALLLSGKQTDAETILSELNNLQETDGSFAQFYSLTDTYSKTIYYASLAALVCYAACLYHQVTGLTTYQAMAKDAGDYLVTLVDADDGGMQTTAADMSKRTITNALAYFALRELHQTYITGSPPNIEDGTLTDIYIPAGPGPWATLTNQTADRYAGNYALKLITGASGISNQYGAGTKYGGDSGEPEQGCAYGGPGTYLTSEGGDPPSDSSWEYACQFDTTLGALAGKHVYGHAKVKTAPGVRIGILISRNGGDGQEFRDYFYGTGDYQTIGVSGMFNTSDALGGIIRIWFDHPNRIAAGTVMYVDNWRCQDGTVIDTYGDAAEKIKSYMLSNLFDSDTGTFYFADNDLTTKHLLAQVFGGFMLNVASSSWHAPRQRVAYGAGQQYGDGSQYGTWSHASFRNFLNSAIQGYALTDNAGRLAGYDVFKPARAIFGQGTALTNLLTYKAGFKLSEMGLSNQDFAGLIGSGAMYGDGSQYGAGVGTGGMPHTVNEQYGLYKYKSVGATAWLLILLQCLTNTNLSDMMFNGNY